MMFNLQSHRETGGIRHKLNDALRATKWDLCSVAHVRPRAMGTRSGRAFAAASYYKAQLCWQQ